MEMNRYLLTALYVMAGCAVVIPLKAQSNAGLLGGERCRVLVTDTVRIISVCLEEEEAGRRTAARTRQRREEGPERRSSVLSCPAPDGSYAGPLCRSACMIRAPGCRPQKGGI